MKSLLVFLLFVLPLKMLAISFNISGKIVDANTKKPVRGAKVFVNRSFKASLTDSSGDYGINSITDSIVEVVVALDGYETLVYQASATKPLVNVRFEMVPSPARQGETQVEEERLQLFYAHFLGVTDNGFKTYIVNPDVLRFAFNDTTQELFVSATGMLQIMNEGLGYMVNYQLESFTLVLASQLAEIQGYCFFKSLTTKNTDLFNSWQEQRRIAYDGCLLHFMRSFYQNKVDEEGFKLRKVTRYLQGDDEYKAALRSKDNLVKSGTTIVNGTNKRFADVADEAYLLPPSLRSIDHTQPGVLLASANPLLVEFKLSLRRSNLPAGIPRDARQNKASLLYISSQGVRVMTNGSYFETADLFVQGFMMEKVGELLPSEYRPVSIAD